MAISVTCDCGKSYRLGDDKAGKRFKCRECGEPVRVPEADGPEDDWDDHGDDGGDDWGDEEEEMEQPAPRRRSASAGGKKKGGKKGGKKGSKKGDSNKAPLFIGIGVAVVLIGGAAGAYFAFSGGDENADSVASNDTDPSDDSGNRPDGGRNDSGAGNGVGGGGGNGGPGGAQAGNLDLPGSGQDGRGQNGGRPGGQGRNNNGGNGGRPGNQQIASGPPVLEGVWTVDVLEVNGRQSDPGGGRFIVEGQTARFATSAGDNAPMRMVVDWKKRPPTIDLLNGQQVASRGVISIQSGTMSLCLVNGPQAQRPNSFQTRQGDGRSLMKLSKSGGGIGGGPLAGGPTVDIPITVPSSPVAGTTDLATYMGDDTFLTVALNPGRAKSSPVLKQFPLEQMAQQAAQQTLVDLSKLKSAFVSVQLSDATVQHVMSTLENSGTPPQDPQQTEQWGQKVVMNMLSGGFNPGDLGVVFIQFEDGVDLVPLIKQFGGMALANLGPMAKVEQAGTGNRPYVRITAGPANLALYMPNSSTVVLAGEGALNKMLDQSAGTSQTSSTGAEFARLVNERDIVIAGSYAKLHPHLDRIRKFVDALPELPPSQTGPLDVSVDQIFEQLKSNKSYSLAVDLSGEYLLSVENVSIDEASTQAAEAEMRKTLFTLSGLYTLGRAQVEQQGIPPQLLEAADYMMQNIKIESNGDRLFVGIPTPKDLPQLIQTVVLPAVSAARGAAQNMSTMNNMKQISLAMFNYHDTRRAFPQNSQLSWRVHLLPYLELAPLYEQFNMNEPWDSPHNKALLAQMPDVYASAEPAGTGMTRFRGFNGQNTIFGSQSSLKIASIIDGTSLTISFIEAGPDKAVEWTKPEELPFNADPLSALGAISPTGFLAAFVDGSVVRIADISTSDLKAMLTYNGTEPVQRPRSN